MTTIIDTVMEKAVRYNTAMTNLAKLPEASEFNKSKNIFKEAVQGCLCSGISKERLIELLPQIEKASANLTTKIKRYARKLEPGHEAKSEEEFKEAATKLSKLFMKVRFTEEYTEFRRAKKGVKGEEYVGYFKFVKKNWKEIAPHLETLKKEMQGLDSKIIAKLMTAKKRNEAKS